jgi:hypothetical protein
MENKFKEVVFSKNTIEFVTVANEFCLFLEKATETDASFFIDKSLKLLSLLYLKASLLPPTEQLYDEGNEKFVGEFDWQMIRNGIASILDDKDTYLDFFDLEMNETPEPVVSSISENMADTYQDLKDFLEIYRLGNDELSNDAIYECNENFKNYWGFRVVNTIRILHFLHFRPKDDTIFEASTAKNLVKRNPDNWFITKAQQDSQAND